MRTAWVKKKKTKNSNKTCAVVRKLFSHHWGSAFGSWQIDDAPAKGLAGLCGWLGAAQTHDGGSQQREVQSASDDVQCLPISLSCFSAIQTWTSCNRLLRLVLFLLLLWTLGARMCHVPLPWFAFHRPSSSPSPASDNIVLGECCSGFARKGWISVHQRMHVAYLSPKAFQPWCHGKPHLPYSPICGSAALLSLVAVQAQYLLHQPNLHPYLENATFVSVN